MIVEIGLPLEVPTAITSLLAQSIVKQSASGTPRRTTGLILTENKLPVRRSRNMCIRYTLYEGPAVAFAPFSDRAVGSGTQ
jgi:hypothetical protein